MWHDHPLKDRYDVVIIGGGIHGLATAYYLAHDHGITDVAVLEKRYIGAGGSGRNTTIIRSNYLTPEGVVFYDESVKLYEKLALDLDFNVMFSQRGHLTLAHNDSAVRTMRWRAEVNQIQGVDSRLIFVDEIARLCPLLDLSDHPRYPVQAALYHPPGGIIRHDAVIWGYARGADRRGVHIHQLTEVTGIDITQGRVVGVQTNRGAIKTGTVMNATAGWATLIADMAGVRLPITTHRLHACVTEPLKPLIDVIIVSGSLCISASRTGGTVMGSGIDLPDLFDGFHADLWSLSAYAGTAAEPACVKIMRQWAGLCDMTRLQPGDGFHAR
jgi:sarcosine oxidase subunit beta